MNGYLLFGFAFLFFAVVGFFGINNNTISSSSSNLITTINTGGIMLSFEALFKDIFYRNNHNPHYITDRDQPSLDFYTIPVAYTQEQQTEEIDDMNNNNDKENTDKYIILVFDRGYKTTFTKAKPILDKYGFKATLFVACDRTQSPKGLSWDQLRQLQN